MCVFSVCVCVCVWSHSFTPLTRVQFLPLVSPADATFTLGSHVLNDVFFPVSSCSESSEEDSAGEKEEEIGQHNEVTCSTKTTEVPAEHTSNAQTGEGWRKDTRLCVCLLFRCPSLNSNMGGANVMTTYRQNWAIL